MFVKVEWVNKWVRIHINQISSGESVELVEYHFCWPAETLISRATLMDDKCLAQAHTHTRVCLQQPSLPPPPYYTHNANNISKLHSVFEVYMKRQFKHFTAKQSPLCLPSCAPRLCEADTWHWPLNTTRPTKAHLSKGPATDLQLQYHGDEGRHLPWNRSTVWIQMEWQSSRLIPWDENKYRSGKYQAVLGGLVFSSYYFHYPASIPEVHYGLLEGWAIKMSTNI